MSCTVGYFSMEIALEPAMPTYAGGLGVLAGDTLRAAADVLAAGAFGPGLPQSTPAGRAGGPGHAPVTGFARADAA
jgi:hypothetical protein